MGLITRIRNAKELEKIPEANIGLVIKDPIDPTEREGGLVYRLQGGPHLFMGQLAFSKTDNYYTKYSLSSTQYGYLLRTPDGVRILLGEGDREFVNYRHTGGIIVLQDFPNIWRQQILIGNNVYSHLEEMGIPDQHIESLKEMIDKQYPLKPKQQ